MQPQAKTVGDVEFGNIHGAGQVPVKAAAASKGVVPMVVATVSFAVVAVVVIVPCVLLLLNKQDKPMGPDTASVGFQFVQASTDGTPPPCHRPCDVSRRHH